jgi:hypothetical protein
MQLSHVELVHACRALLFISLIVIVITIFVEVILRLAVLFLYSFVLSGHSFLRLIISFLPTHPLLNHSQSIFYLVQFFIILS